jgi:hypothetical protein
MELGKIAFQENKKGRVVKLSLNLIHERLTEITS